jgi:protein tyrosine phosphatase (PTP) superfamily phosphohydrolase (DUF442 family)
MTRAKLTLVVAAAIVAACQSVPNDEAKTPVAAPPPLEGVDNAYEAAGKQKLENVAPEEYPGLHNVYHLSSNIVSGGEPHGEAALKRISEMGVKTILSVDGKIPDQKTAAKYGMRYVHVPIKYSGIEPEDLLRIAKMFRELEGPFYVHCFHGKHRGPAAAAVGRLVLDGAAREQALAEMRQWCGTAEKYEGLFRLIATQEMPTANESAKLDWDFPAARPLGDFRNVMIEITRHSDNLKALSAREWKTDPDHPDIDPLNESEKIAGLFARGAQLDSVKQAKQDFRDWMGLSAQASADLVAALKSADKTSASKAWRTVKKTCGACHSEYRN